SAPAPGRTVRPARCWTCASRSASRPTAEETSVPTDSFGDPLPAGVVARLGCLRLRQGCTVTGLSLSSDGKLLASLRADDNLLLWDLSAGRGSSQVRPFDLPGKQWQRERRKVRAHSAVFSPDLGTLALGTGQGTVQMWDLASGELRQTLTGHGNAVTGLAWA